MEIRCFFRPKYFPHLDSMFWYFPDKTRTFHETQDFDIFKLCGWEEEMVEEKQKGHTITLIHK